MKKNDDIAPSLPPPERRYRRFSLHYPVRVKVQSDDLITEFEAVSRNISIGGLLLETAALIPRDTPVSFVVTAAGRDPGHAIQFIGEGKVVRVDPAAKAAFAIAVECQRPIAQINQLEATGS
jgi:hypothetical protein